MLEEVDDEKNLTCSTIKCKYFLEKCLQMRSRSTLLLFDHFRHVRPSYRPGPLMFFRSELITPGTYGLASLLVTKPFSAGGPALLAATALGSG